MLKPTSRAIRHSVRLILVAAFCFVVAERASTQAPTAADGPWAGWAQCQLTAQLSAQGQTYLNQQTHTWVLTGFTPASGTAIKAYPATWRVTGQGSRQRDMGDGRTVVEQWTTAGQAMPDTISVRLSADGLVHFTSGAQLRSVNATTGTGITRSTSGRGPDQTTQIGYYVDEWTFPVVEDMATKTTISGSTTGPATNIAPGQPPGTLGTAACSWQFVRGATSVLLPPEPTSSATAAATASSSPTVSLSAAGSGGTIQTAASGTTSGTTSKDTTLRQEALSSGTLSALNTLLAPSSTTSGTGSSTSSTGSSTPAQMTDLSVQIVPEFVTAVGSFAVPTAGWHVTFLNAGPNDANGALVSAYNGSPDPSILGTGTVACYGMRGASCPAVVGPAQAGSGMAIPVWPPGGEVHLLVRTVVSAGRFAILDASATASASATDSSPSNNWSEATYPVAGTSMRPKADVGISVGAGPLGQTSGGFPAILSQNGRANFFVSAINAGPDWADGARVVVPPGLPKESVGCMPSGGALCPSGAITGAQLEAGIAIPILPPGGRVNFQIFVRVTPGIYAAMTASVTPPASLDDPRADNNNGSIGFQVVAP